MECSVLTLPALHIWQIHSFFTAFLVKIFQPQSLPTRRVFYGLPHRLAAKVNNFEIRLTLISLSKTRHCLRQQVLGSRFFPVYSCCNISSLKFLKFYLSQIIFRSSVLHHHFYLPEVDIKPRSKMTKEPQQSSPMSKMDRYGLPSTPWPFWTCISIDDEECCF